MPLSDEAKDELQKAVVLTCVCAVWATCGRQDRKQSQIFGSYFRQLEKLGLVSIWEEALVKIKEQSTVSFDPKKGFSRSVSPRRSREGPQEEKEGIIA
jgi:hypothetical protein